MDRIRRRAAWIVAAVFACQIAGIFAAPVAMCRDGVEPATSVACTCTHADGAPCPMHKHAVQSVAPTKRDCSCRSAADPSETFVGALLSSPAVVPAAIVPAAPFALQRFAQEARVTVRGIVPVPDGPPPRA
jgi:hypothetical protein